MAIKTRYRVKKSDGQYQVVHFETTADQVIVTDEKQFVTSKEKESLQQIKGYTHNQIAASDTWSINHGLDKFPSVSIVDSAGSLVMGDILYKDSNNIELKFSSGFAGTAYLN